MIEDFKIRVFLTVAAEGSFTRAARSLGITQPAVSMQVADLEKSLGVSLLERGRGSITLTEAGSVFLSYAERIRNLYDKVNHLFGKEGFPDRPVFIRATDFVVSRYLPHRLPEVKAVTGVEFVVNTCAEGEVDGFLLDLQGADLLLYATMDPDGKVHLEKKVSEHFARTPLYAILSDYLQ